MTEQPKRTCLIVDDNELTRRVLSALMTSLNYHVAEAADGREALVSCDRMMPDAILLDWALPDATGIETLHSLRRRPGGERPVVIYCPTEYDEQDCASARANGANGVLPKPFNRALLHAALAHAGLE